ncbi:MAG: cell division protein FtsL [Pseudomonadota bacterium]
MPRPQLNSWSVLVLGLGWAAVASALSIVDASHQCRQQFAELQSLQSKQWHMQEQRGRLLLQLSTLAAHQRVERLARRELGMRLPSMHELEVVTP